MAAVIAVWAAKPKYVFVFVGDGMGMGHVMATETYNRTVLGNDDNILMMRFPVASMAMTYSASSPITDSAAAGTALATGSKTKNSMVGMSPDTVAVESVSHELKRKLGYGVGIVTSVCYDDATPATHFAHQANRKMYEEINRDGAESGFDFIAGANTLARNDKEKTARIFDGYRKNGYTVAGSIAELKAASAFSWNGKMFRFSPRRTLCHLIMVSSGVTPRTRLSRTIRRRSRLSEVEMLLFSSREREVSAEA